MSGLALGDWEAAVASFASAIAAAVPTESIKAMMATKFSTTGPTEAAVHSMAFMDAVKHFYSFSIATRCGIPHIEIEGTQADWQLLLASLSALDDLGLTAWKKQLEKILGHFCAAFDGEADTEFWQGIYLIHGSRMSGEATTVSGWLTHLFPYLADGSKNTGGGNGKKKKGLPPSAFPRGISTTQCTDDDTKVTYLLCSGMLGTTIDAGGVCSAELGWVVWTKAEPRPPPERRVSKRHREE
jgi:Domain of unknown function (DUF4419)